MFATKCLQKTMQYFWYNSCPIIYTGNTQLYFCHYPKLQEERDCFAYHMTWTPKTRDSYLAYGAPWRWRSPPVWRLRERDTNGSKIFSLFFCCPPPPHLWWHFYFPGHFYDMYDKLLIETEAFDSCGTTYNTELTFHSQYMWIHLSSRTVETLPQANPAVFTSFLDAHAFHPHLHLGYEGGRKGFQRRNQKPPLPALPLILSF